MSELESSDQLQKALYMHSTKGSNSVIRQPNNTSPLEQASECNTEPDDLD